MIKHPQNGPTFSKAPSKKHRMTDAERAAWEARKDAKLEETKRAAAGSRSFLQHMHNDPTSWIEKYVRKPK